MFDCQWEWALYMIFIMFQSKEVVENDSNEKNWILYKGRELPYNRFGGGKMA
jgi:hypothetical protein